MTLYAPLRLRLVLIASVLALALLTGSGAPAWADGDPGSDVLVYQSLFVGSDAGIPIPAQLRLGDLLRSSASSGAPIRVAIIAHRDDLGSVTGLWRRPAAYAHFLGYELSLGYSGRLLVVMPNGLAVNWPHHAIQAAAHALSKIATGPSGARLTAAAEEGVLALAARAGVTLRPPVKGAAGRPRPAPAAAVWHAYGIQASIQRGLISHTPALYLIDRQGRLRRLYLTQQSYAAVGQFGQVLAHEVSALLPAHPRVRSHLAYAPPQTITPRQSRTLAAAGGGRITLGPGRPRLYVFFDTWDREVTGLAGELDALNAYARRARLPQLAGVDESVVEPSRRTLPRFLKTLPAPLRYPVAVDTTGRVGDGYQVQGLPTLVLTSAAGKIVWYDAVNTSRWPTLAALERQVKTALAPADSPSMSTPAMLLGSPAPLAELHRQAGHVIGDGAQLEARIRTLRGYPIVLNAWASWCSPCKAEFSLFAAASKQFGRQVAFLGVNTNDPSPAAAAAFLRAHPVSYPSYRDKTTGLRSLLPAGFEGLPTTIFLAPDGRVTEVHTGQYDAQGSLDADIKRYALETG